MRLSAFVETGLGHVKNGDLKAAERALEGLISRSEADEGVERGVSKDVARERGGERARKGWRSERTLILADCAGVVPLDTGKADSEARTTTAFLPRGSATAGAKRRPLAPAALPLREDLAGFPWWWCWWCEDPRRGRALVALPFNPARAP